MKKSFYIFSVDGSEFRSASGQEAEEASGTEESVVTVESESECHHKLSVEQYYFSGGKLELIITQPLWRALQTYSKLLQADFCAEAGFGGSINHMPDN